MKDHAAKKNSIFLFNPTVHISSAFYKQLMQFVEVQQMFHFSSLYIEPKYNKTKKTKKNETKYF